jgi:hypothetical protein
MMAYHMLLKGKHNKWRLCKQSIYVLEYQTYELVVMKKQTSLIGKHANLLMCGIFCFCFFVSGGES